MTENQIEFEKKVAIEIGVADFTQVKGKYTHPVIRQLWSLWQKSRMFSLNQAVTACEPMQLPIFQNKTNREVAFICMRHVDALKSL